MKTELQKTAEYPVRYNAFDKNGILFVNENPKKSGGNEWAIYDDKSKELYGSIVSYQNLGLLVEISRKGILETIPFADFRKFWSYEEFNLATERLLKKLESFY